MQIVDARNTFENFLNFFVLIGDEIKNLVSLEENLINYKNSLKNNNSVNEDSLVIVASILKIEKKIKYSLMKIKNYLGNSNDVDNKKINCELLIRTSIFKLYKDYKARAKPIKKLVNNFKRISNIFKLLDKIIENWHKKIKKVQFILKELGQNLNSRLKTIDTEIYLLQSKEGIIKYIAWDCMIKSDKKFLSYLKNKDFSLFNSEIEKKIFENNEKLSQIRNPFRILKFAHLGKHSLIAIFLLLQSMNLFAFELDETARRNHDLFNHNLNSVEVDLSLLDVVDIRGNFEMQFDRLVAQGIYTQEHAKMNIDSIMDVFSDPEEVFFEMGNFNFIPTNRPSGQAISQYEELIESYRNLNLEGENLIRYVYDDLQKRLGGTASYDFTHMDNYTWHHPASVLFEGHGSVCRERSLLFYDVLKNLGFESRVIIGEPGQKLIGKGVEQGHAWVSVFIDNRRVEFDLTWYDTLVAF